MPSTVLRNIGELVLVPPGPVKGRSMRHIETVEGAALVMVDGDISWFGPSSAGGSVS